MAKVKIPKDVGNGKRASIHGGQELDLEREMNSRGRIVAFPYT